MLKELRKKAGFTQLEVAKFMNVTDATVCQWENGDTKPRADKLLKLAALYSCTVEELLKED